MKYSVLLLLLPLMFGCNSNPGPKPESNDYDWVPAKFKAEHPDEWAVVNAAINNQQSEDGTDFSYLDSLVMDYLDKKETSLPSDVNQRIERIAEVCSTKFNFEDSAYTNMDMHIAAGTNHLFDSYINWLYEREAVKILSQNKLVDMEHEMEEYARLNLALRDVCDTVAFRMEGSGGWTASSYIADLFIVYQKCMWQAIVGATLEQKKELDVPLDLFDIECKALNDNYEPYSDEQLKDVSHIVDRYKNAFHSWYAYRKSVAAGIKDKTFKRAYESITYSFARIYFLDLKNRFSFIGLTNPDAFDYCLDKNCSNQELLDYNYENSRKEWEDQFEARFSDN